MSPFYSFSSRVACLIRGYILLSLLFALFAVPSPASAEIRGVFAAATQEIPDPIPPCITTGYAVDATLDIPLQGDTPVVNVGAVDTSRRADRVGYILTRNNTNSTEVWVYIYNAVTMVVTRSFRLQDFGQLDYGNQRLVAVLNNELYLVRNINGGRLGCGIGRVCASLTKITPSGTAIPGLTIDLVTLSFGGFDDFVVLSDGTAMLGFSDGSNRRLMNINAVGFGPPLTGFAGQVVFAYREDGTPLFYAGSLNGTTIKSFLPGDTTPLDSDVYSYTLSNTSSAFTTVLSRNLLLGMSTSFAGSAANIAYKDLAMDNVRATESYPFSTDGSASRGGTYWDNINNVLHSLRIDAGSGAPSIIRSSIQPLSIQQRFSCAFCDSSLFRNFNFVQPTLRFYVNGTSAASVGRVTRIKVCATGGPPA